MTEQASWQFGDCRMAGQMAMKTDEGMEENPHRKKPRWNPTPRGMATTIGGNDNDKIQITQ